MNDLQALYQEVLLDHYRRPRNFGEIAAPTGRAEGNNPLCGDRVTVEVVVAGDRLEQVVFRGSGCAISTASASLMTEAISGRSLDEVRALSERFRGALTAAAPRDTPTSAESSSPDLGKLEALLGVREFPMRVKCATLAWHALGTALASGGIVSTE